MKRYIFLVLAVAMLATSCDDWLDVRGENIQKEKNQFENYKGFRDALTGCYMAMADVDAYGQKLTMTSVENMASLWYCSDLDEQSETEAYCLKMHLYDHDNARPAIKAMYAKLFHTITSANVLLKNIQERGGNITSKQTRAVIEGEAYAIRAYCQFDVLRLFGQLPKGGSRQVSLPYSYTTAIDEVPAYYGFADYVAHFKADITKAEELLKDNDPIFSQTFTELNNPWENADDFLCYRQSRLNYWAVRALHARMALYLGETQEAHDIAMEIIHAQGVDGTPVMSLSGITDLQNGYNGLPSECLFYLSKYNVNDYANDLLIGGRNVQASNSKYHITAPMLNDLYASIPGSMASHNRYLCEWNRGTKNAFAEICPTIKKYWYDESKAVSSALITKHQIIPMLRMSEMYLIAIECSQSLAEVQELYMAYMTACQFVLFTPFESLKQARAEMVNEYRREFYAEGQMFYTYKRLAATQMQWNSKTMTEDDYIVPLPSTEYVTTQK